MAAEKQKTNRGTSSEEISTLGSADIGALTTPLAFKGFIAPEE
jgi:hypothetical protein